MVLTGFGEGNQQLRVNGLTWGRDNWVYGANGRSGGAVRRPSDPPEKAVSIARNDFPVVQAIVLVLAMIYIALRLAADLLNALLDPRRRA